MSTEIKRSESYDSSKQKKNRSPKTRREESARDKIVEYERRIAEGNGYRTVEPTVGDYVFLWNDSIGSYECKEK